MDVETNSSKIIGYWLLIGAFLVICMVVLGGYTRLSHSGLSMVTWKPVIGVIPPTNNEAWEKEFDRYKTSPEYKKRNYNFTLEEFKTIYWPEFSHRVLGRVLGLAFVIPFLYFLRKKYLKDRELIKDLIIIFFLGGLQGLIGWYMVKSGLVDNPNVSHYRLAIHLCTALTLYGYILWTALKVLFPHQNMVTTEFKSIKKLLLILLVINTLQIIYGAFLAGLKAGSVFNTFPKMGTSWIPEIITTSIGREGIISFFEFPVLVQFIHRWVAILVVGAVVWLYIKSRKFSLTSIQQKSIFAIIIAVCIQFLLGVITLIHLVPMSLGLLHQLGAVALLTTIIITLYSFYYPQEKGNLEYR